MFFSSSVDNAELGMPPVESFDETIKKVTETL
jgi:hypothetical protein